MGLAAKEHLIALLMPDLIYPVQVSEWFYQFRDLDPS